MRVINTKQYFEEEKEIASYLSTTGKSENERLNILNECWENEDTHQQWLLQARRNKPKGEPQEEGTAAASHNDGQQQMHNTINSVKKELITRAKIDVHDAIKHGNIDPVIAAKDAVSNAIGKAVEELGAAARMELRKS